MGVFVLRCEEMTAHSYNFVGHFKKTSHEISFSSDGINISSLRILKMSDKIASTCDDCRFFLPKSLIGDNIVDFFVPRIKKTRTIFHSQI